MACLGGTVEEPRIWWRLGEDGYIRVEGRICDRESPRTSKTACWACVAYRGPTVPPRPYFNPDGDPYAMSDLEHDRYDDAVEATFDDDFGPLAMLLDQIRARTEGAQAIGDQALRRIGDPDALARDVARHQAWRLANPEAARRLNREAVRSWRGRNRTRYNTYQRELMRKRRASRC